VPTTTWNKRWGTEVSRLLVRRRHKHYGTRWGGPDASQVAYFWHKLRRRRPRPPGNLAKIRRRYLEPYVTPDTVALEIGPGGGRWTRYLLGARELVLVELNSEFFPYLRNRFRRADHLRFYQTSGYEMAGVDDGSIDFVFSFATFVHIDPDGIDAYLGEIRRVLHPGGIATLHYADRSKKFFARRRGYGGFSNMTGPKMEELAARHAFDIVKHDRRTLNHSNVIVLRRPAAERVAGARAAH
jgi:SAM-dependent methyltransferase